MAVFSGNRPSLNKPVHSNRKLVFPGKGVPIDAIGGTITEYYSEEDNTVYRIHAFTDVGEDELNVLASGGGDFGVGVDVLVVAGGGGGATTGSDTGGGGAGGLILRPILPISQLSIPVSVGDGGDTNNNGNNSTFDFLTALGGGSGSTSQIDGISGGSGGGAGRNSGVGGEGLQPSQSGESGEFGFGNGGGTNTGHSGTDGMGGGGAGGPGVDAIGIDAAIKTGGIGLNLSHLFGNVYGENGWFAGGGGGGGERGNFTQNLGGIGGGGRGGHLNSEVSRDGEDGQTNTGGGGGGADNTTGGRGGSGIVLIRYPIFRPMVATGGNVTDVEIEGRLYRVHSFTDVGEHTFEVTDTGDLRGECDVLVLAGGGGGGSDNAGGGGGGGVLNDTINVIPSSYELKVGDGGRGSGTSNANLQENGENSSAFNLIAFGGGFGGNGQAGSRPASSGGSGGGGHGELLLNSPPVPDYSGGSGILGQGNNGGNGTPAPSINFQGAGGGGGGASQVGETAVLPFGGKGGDGFLSNISGTLLHYGSGGGGGSGGVGANGGGGAGDYAGGGERGGTRTINFGESGVVNTGGGGGGSENSGTSGGTGGSGIVIIRYPLEPEGV
jgi:hypothetical protein